VNVGFIVGVVAVAVGYRITVEHIG
jgi:hypothetical protein